MRMGSAARVLEGLRILVSSLLLTGLLLPMSATSQEWAFDPNPVLRIGGSTKDPDYILSTVVGGLRLEDGRIVLADRFTYGLRVYSPDGTFLKEVGGEGEGPGEFEYIRGMDRCAGYPAVAFDLHWDMKLYDADLHLADERSARLPGISGTPYAFDCTGSGHWVLLGVGTRGWGSSFASPTPACALPESAGITI